MDRLLSLDTAYQAIDQTEEILPSLNNLREGGGEKKNLAATMPQKPGVILDYDKDGNILGLEVLDASKRIDNPRSVEYAVAD